MMTASQQETHISTHTLTQLHKNLRVADPDSTNIQLVLPDPDPNYSWIRIMDPTYVQYFLKLENYAL